MFLSGRARAREVFTVPSSLGSRDLNQRGGKVGLSNWPRVSVGQAPGVLSSFMAVAREGREELSLSPLGSLEEVRGHMSCTDVSEDQTLIFGV